MRRDASAASREADVRISKGIRSPVGCAGMPQRLVCAYFSNAEGFQRANVHISRERRLPPSRLDGRQAPGFDIAGHLIRCRSRPGFEASFHEDFVCW